MTWATVVNLHHRVPCSVYVGRRGHGLDGALGNPIAVDHACLECGAVHGHTPALLVCYGKWLARTIANSTAYRDSVIALHGRVLGCFCVRPDGSGICHGKVLARESARLHGDVWYRVGTTTTNNRLTAGEWCQKYRAVLEVTDSGQSTVYERWRYASGAWVSADSSQLALFS